APQPDMAAAATERRRGCGEPGARPDRPGGRLLRLLRLLNTPRRAPDRARRPSPRRPRGRARRAGRAGKRSLGAGMRSGQLAAAAGVNLQTLRYYERLGLLPEPERSLGGHRNYGQDAATILRIVK